MPRRPLSSPGEIPLYQRSLDEDLVKVSRNQLAEKITGGLLKPSKMPTFGWGISAFRCKVGAALRNVENSTCSECYALKGRYALPNVQNKLEERYQGLFDPRWAPALIFLLNWNCERCFRWFDSGDLVDANHLRNIVTIAENTRHLLHWLPTGEATVVKTVQKEHGQFPSNLVVRVSGAMIDVNHPVDTNTRLRSFLT